MKQYGFTYMGSKVRIAEEIIDLLPAGKRLVDLMGGGGAITHCAALSGKWESVWYNDVDWRVVQNMRRIISGFYTDPCRFEPYWVDKDQFFLSDDPYELLCFSFGADMHTYFTSEKNESNMRTAFKECMAAADWRRARLRLKDRHPTYASGRRLVPLECLERFENITRSISKDGKCGITCTAWDYHRYNPQYGDVVYIDPPYQNTQSYSTGEFDSKAFWDWAANIPCYVSSFECLRLDVFHEIMAIPVHENMSGKAKSKDVRYERLFTNVLAEEG